MIFGDKASANHKTLGKFIEKFAKVINNKNLILENSIMLSNYQ
jgi:hypothetical protein